MSPERVTTGAHVSFRLGDVVCPLYGQILRQLSPDVGVCGEVAFLSDRGHDKGHFAIVSVKGIDLPLVVPIALLRVQNALPVQPTDQATESNGQASACSPAGVEPAPRSALINEGSN